MKPARIVDRDLKPANVGDVVAVRPERDGVVVVRRVADPVRRRRVVRLLSMLLDKPDAPDDGGRR